MADVNDVAAYVLEQQGRMTTMQLQKLVYYSQAWHLVWDGRPLFDARIEAWMNGPVVPELYRQHRGRFVVDSWPSGNPAGLVPSEKETVDVVLQGYGHLSPQAISELTHREAPWIDAREGMSPTDRGSQTITPDAMQQFYDAIDHS